MKRFNIDELIWFIILCFLDVSLIYLIRTEEITNFVDTNIIKYFYISIVLLFIFSIYQFQCIFTIRPRVEKTNKFIPITFALVIGVILLFVMPKLSDNSTDIINSMKNKFNEDVIVIDCNNFKNFNIDENNMENYNGKLIVFQGYVDYTENTDQTIISREVVTCCQGDKEKIMVIAKGIDTSLKEGQWIIVVGRANIKDNVKLNIVDYKLTNKPKEVYLHEHL